MNVESGKKLRIVLLEDVPTDAELIERALRQAGLQFSSSLVNTKASFVRTLEEFEPDIVLSDYNLPDINGLEALKIVQEKRPHVPVIEVTGALGDEAAVELVRAGAKDYVLKDRLARLPFAVQRALAEAEEVRCRKNAQEELAESEEKFRTIVEVAQDAIIAMDCEGRVTSWNRAAERILGFTAKEMARKGAIERIVPPRFRDKMREGMKEFAQTGGGTVIGKTLEFEALRQDGLEIPIELSVSAMRMGGQWHAVAAIRDVTQRKRAEEALRRLNHALQETLKSVAAVIETRDGYAVGHQRRVARLAVAIARELGLSADMTDGIYMAALVHDVASITVQGDILCKPAALTPLERELVEKHVQSAYEMLKGIEFPWPIAMMIKQHHERLDGSGYPNHLRGDAILIEARILAISDVMAAMTSARPYRPAFDVDAALIELEKNRGILFESAAVDACARLFREKGFSFD